MTRKELEAERKRRQAAGGKYHEAYDDLSLREMVNSTLCYGRIEDFWAEPGYRESYAAPYIRRLGRETVQKIVDDQAEDFRKRSRVIQNVHTDFEGCSYNSIVWADET